MAECLEFCFAFECDDGVDFGGLAFARCGCRAELARVAGAGFGLVIGVDGVCPLAQCFGGDGHGCGGFKLIALSIKLMCIWMIQVACKPTGRFIFGI